jgi:hypothetical protein
MNSITAYSMKTNNHSIIFTAQAGKADPFSLLTRLIRRFRYFIEGTDWDKELLRYEKEIDRLCWIILVASAIFFLPVTISIVSK